MIAPLRYRLSLFIALALWLTAFGPAEAGRSVFPDLKKVTLGNELKVNLLPDNRHPLASFALTINAGSGADTRDKSGLATLTGMMLRQGSRNYPDEALLKVFDSLGGTLEMAVYRDYAIITGDVLARDIELALTILADMIIRPNFTPETLSRLKRQLVSEIMHLDSSPEYVGDNVLYTSFYPESGYGLPLHGTMAGIRKINLDDINDYYRMYFQPGNASLTVTGDFDPASLKKHVVNDFSAWPKGPVVKVTPPVPVMSDSLKILLVDNPSAPSCYFAIGRPAVPISDDRFSSLNLVNYIIGGGNELSRLNRRLVREQSLAINVNSRIDMSHADGMLIVSGRAANELAADALVEALKVMQDMGQMKVPSDELNEARRFYRNIFYQLFETSIDKAVGLGHVMALGEEAEYYDKLIEMSDRVDSDYLRQLAAEFFSPAGVRLVVVGPELELRSRLLEIAPVAVSYTHLTLPTN